MGFAIFLYGYLIVNNEQDSAIISSLKYSVNGAKGDQKELIFGAFNHSKIVNSRFMTEELLSQLKEVYEIYSFRDEPILWERVVAGSVIHQNENPTFYTDLGWSSTFEVMKYSDLATVDIDKYQNDLSELKYNNYKKLIPALRDILASGIAEKDPEKIKNEFVLKLAVKGLSGSGLDINLEGSLGAQFWLRLRQRLRKQKIKNKGNKVSKLQLNNTVQKMLVPV